VGMAKMVILAGLAWVGLAVGSPAVAQHDDFAGQQRSAAINQQSYAGEAIIQDGQSDALLVEPTNALPNTVLIESESSVAGEGICLDGGTYGQCPVGPCCAVCGGGSCCPDNWYFRQGVRILSYGSPRGTLTSRELGGISGEFASKMTTRSVGFDTAAGYAATIGRYLGRDTENRDQFVEFTYWGLNTWTESRTINGTNLQYDYVDESQVAHTVLAGSLFSPFDDGFGAFARVGGFNRAERHYLWYQAEMNNYEVNLWLRPRSRGDRLVLHPNGRWRRECLPGEYLSYLFGLRVLSVHEMIRFHGSGTVSDNGVPSGVWGNYDVLTHNELLGLQIGADYIYRRCKWRWGFQAKAGPYVNFSDQVTTVATSADGDPIATIPLDFRRTARRNSISLVGEVGVVGSYKLRPNFAVSAAYDLIWVTGLVRAPEQFTFQTNPPSQINRNGLVFSQGLTLELEWTR